MLSFWYAFLNAPNDADATVAMKAERSAHRPQPNQTHRRRPRRTSPTHPTRTLAEHADQLTHLLSLTRLPFISVGVIPADAQRPRHRHDRILDLRQHAVALESPTRRSR